jgi:tRNA/tmRNA/rRNA uracil-C5-methylase (TrmA/RlmC/RlmD family)
MQKKVHTWPFDYEKKQGLRRKITLHVDRVGRIGFFQKSSNDLVEIDACAVSEFRKVINSIKNFLGPKARQFEKISLVLFDSGLSITLHFKKKPELAIIQQLAKYGSEQKVNIYSEFKGKTRVV